MNQLSFSDIEYSNRRRKTKREEFLDSMDKIIPWSHWIGIIQPYYYNNKRGRRPIDLEVMYNGPPVKTIDKGIYRELLLTNKKGERFSRSSRPRGQGG